MTNLPANPDPTLEQLEAVVTEGFIGAFEALGEIHTRRLYLDAYKSFDDYCRERWGFTGRTGMRRIQKAAELPALPVRVEARHAPKDAEVSVVGHERRSSNAPDVVSRTVENRPLDTIDDAVVLPPGARPPLVTETPPAPRDEPEPTQERLAPPEADHAPPEPPEPPPVPSERAQIAHFYGHLADLAPADLWNGSTPEQLLDLAAWINELRAAKMAAQDQPERVVPRSPGRVIRPEDRTPRPASNGSPYPTQRGAPVPTLARRDVQPLFKPTAAKAKGAG